MNYLDNDSTITFLPPNFGPIGAIVDNRTYRRWLPEMKRRETFRERNRRTVNYSISLIDKNWASPQELVEEAELYYSYLNSLLVWPSGRTQWVGGTPCTEKNPEANFNCSALAINRPTAFRDIAMLLTLGVGVGFRVHSKDVNQLPKITNKPVISFDEYNPLLKERRREYTEVVETDKIHVLVGDSRGGWCDALQILINTYFGIEGWTSTKELVFNFNSVRPKGERIYGFGGTASGPEALHQILKDIQDIFEECPSEKLRSIDCLDIACATARGVIAGSARRSALIGLFEEGDLLCREAKFNLYTDPVLSVKKVYRSQSNNTENIGSRHEEVVRKWALENPDLSINDPKVSAFLKSLCPPKSYFEQLFKTIKTEGEPGFDNYPRMQLLRFYAARKHRPMYSPSEIWDRYCDVVTNPCHEILLNTGVEDNFSVSFCNLTTIPLPNHLYLDEQGKYQYDAKQLETAIRLTVRVGLRQTEVNIPQWNMNDCQREERLLGQSLTGYRDFLSAMGWKTGSEEVKLFLTDLKTWANDEATKYAKELNIPRPLLVTTIKPEGTFSKIVGVSNGLHWDRNPYYIQRMRCSASDALAKTLIAQGIPCYPEVYDFSQIEGLGGPDVTIFEKIKLFDALPLAEQRKILLSCNSVVFEFPIKSISTESMADISAIEQLENTKDLTLYYTDHMPSSTITVKEDEWDLCIDWVINNWDTYTTASFLQYFAEGNYPLLPWEDISEEEYIRRIADIPEQYVKQDDLGRYFILLDEDLLAKFENGEEDILLDSNITSCGLAGGGCPIR